MDVEKQTKHKYAGRNRNRRNVDVQKNRVDAT